MKIISELQQQLKIKYPKLSFVVVKTSNKSVSISLAHVKIEVSIEEGETTLTLMEKLEASLKEKGFKPPPEDYTNSYFVVPSEFDPKDYKIEPASDIPSQVDLRKVFDPIYNQGRTNTCVAQTLVAIKGFQEDIQFGQRASDKRYSVFYIYNQRIMRSVDKGMSLKNALNILVKQGVPLEEDFSTKSPFTPVPTEKLLEKAAKGKIRSYAKILSLGGLKTAIATLGPVAGVLPIYSSKATFWRNEGSAQYQGLHAITILGYSDEDKVIYIRNSWGENWADKGYTEIPYDEFNSFTELWALIDK
jgi:C1A family cysteine protease